MKIIREISVPITDGLTLLHFGFNHEKFTPPPLRETTQKLLEGGGDFFFKFLALIFTGKKSVRTKISAPAPARP
jgi:hypothetical protein